tara:strand:+ start:89 stop:361 length:273 start_codon:yes stop_codon:yes gene_type:complete
MNIKKELIDRLVERMVESPQNLAEELLTLRYRFSHLQSNYDWLQSECDMESNCSEHTDRDTRAEYRDAYNEAKDNYYENEKMLKAKYLSL